MSSAYTKRRMTVAEAYATLPHDGYDIYVEIAGERYDVSGIELTSSGMYFMHMPDAPHGGGGYDDGSRLLTFERVIKPARDADTLRRLWQSTESLFRRFGVYPPGKSEQARVLFEEVYELTEAALWLRCALGDSESLREGDLEELRACVAEEAADVIVTALGVCMANGVSLEAIEAAVELVAAKNDAKQPGVTHEIDNNGKIARIARTVRVK